MTNYSVEFGDVWRMGRHRLLCGDSTERAMVGAFLEGYRPKLCLTDPPYGINYTSKSQNEDLYRLKLKNDHIVSWGDAFRLSQAPVLYVWFSFKHYDVVSRSTMDAGYDIKQMVIWNKNHFSLQRHLYHLQHEQALVCIHRGAKTTETWTGDRKQVSVWNVANVKPKDRIHPTEKPTRVYTIPILNHTHEEEPVLDLFAGSGVVFAACEETKRTGLGVELCPEACSKILTRMAESSLDVEHEGNLFD